MLVKFKSREERLKEITEQFEALPSYIVKWADHYVRQGGPAELNGENGPEPRETVGRWKLMRACVAPLLGHKAEQLVVRAANCQYTKWFVVAMTWKYLERATCPLGFAPEDNGSCRASGG